MKRKVKNYLLKRLSKEKALHMTLIDPEKTNRIEAERIAKEAIRAGTSAIMVGGSIGVSERMVDEVIRGIKKITKNIPVILFPGNPSALSKYADAIWFLSVLNSQNPYFIIGAQMQGAPIVKKYNLEVLSLAYLILGEGGVVSYVSQTRPLPLEKPEIIVSYALAAQYIGFNFVYLEGGSGGKPVSSTIVRYVKSFIEIPLIVGGGIKTYDKAKELVSAGADILVTGTIVEESNDIYSSLLEIIKGIKDGALLKENTGLNTKET
ncbi:MAG: geranylgeranylglyceryl/heptaprenylglyceryl phosphate synthase [Thermoproteales archaeon]|nr:geranylgeranylglyceryl/heptaprenylglyceryl phosphate synthase [Thermoproteales archaeon]